MGERSDWAATAAERIDGLIRSRAPWWTRQPCGGLIATIKSDYEPRPLPEPFEVMTLRARGCNRRLAIARGAGRPIVLLPGLYATLDEGLFIDLAHLIFERLGRSVILLEDRFAAPTVQINEYRLPTLRELGKEAAYVAGSASSLVRSTNVDTCAGPDRADDDAAESAPDALAFSAGAASVLSAEGGCFRRAVLWSAALDPKAVISFVRNSRISNAYFSLLHRRSFRRAGARKIPDRGEMVETLASDRPHPPLDLPVLAIHAEDDPVAPVGPVLALRRRLNLTTCLTSTGGHLGFGAVAGREIYLEPLFPNARDDSLR